MSGLGKGREESSFFGKKEAEKLSSVGLGLSLVGGFLRAGDFMASPTLEPLIRLGGEAKKMVHGNHPLCCQSRNQMRKVFLLLFVHKKKALYFEFLGFKAWGLGTSPRMTLGGPGVRSGVAA